MHPLLANHCGLCKLVDIIHSNKVNPTLCLTLGFFLSKSWSKQLCEYVLGGHS